MKIPYGYHCIDNTDIKAVLDVLGAEFITQGPKVKEFENALCSYTGASYAVAVANGTAALHLANLAAGIKYGDEVITSPISFVASSNSIIYCGGIPVFADIEEDTININPQKIINKISEKTRAILPVHFGGMPCNLEKIYEIAHEKKLIVIEDASHALGAYYNGSKIGACKFSDMTTFSFHPVKSITTGEGGAILTNRKDLYEKLLILRNHGITKDPLKFVSTSGDDSEGSWYYEMQELGFNYRMSDFQAALGVSQIVKIDDFIKRRREIAKSYSKAFRHLSLLILPLENENLYSAFHLYMVQIDFDSLGISRKSVMLKLQEKGVYTQVHYIPIHFQPYYKKKYGYKQGDYPVAESYYGKALSIPLYPAMTDEMVEHVVNAVLSIFKNSDFSA